MFGWQEKVRASKKLRAWAEAQDEYNRKNPVTTTVRVGMETYTQKIPLLHSKYKV